MGVLTAIPHNSDKGFSGLCYALLADFGSVNIAVDASSMTTFTDGDASIGDAFTKFVFPKETSNWTVTGAGSPTAGTTVYNQVLTMFFAKNEAIKRNNIYQMGKKELIAVVVDKNGTAVCLGNDTCAGLDMTSSTGTSGTAAADPAGTTIILSGNFKQPESYVSAEQLALIMPS